MSDTLNRSAWGVIGLIVGFLAGAGFRWWPMFVWMEMGMISPLLVITLWILLIAGAIRLLFMGRDRQRIADLPADFDDWHRRAHAQMAREAASAADSGRRG